MEKALNKDSDVVKTPLKKVTAPLILRLLFQYFTTR